MKHRTRFVAFFASIPLVACSPDFVAPTKSPTTPSLAVAAAPSAGNYMVLMKGNGIPTGFAETVSSLGGTITFAHAPTGFVAVSGLTSVAATKLRATNGVSEVDADQAFSLRDNLMPVSADAAAVGTVVGESQTNPAGAFFYSVAHYQWNMDAISAPAAWAAGKLGSPTVTVAILDTGIDYDSFDERAGSTPGLVDLSRSKSFMDTYEYAPDEDHTIPHLSDDQITSTFFPGRNAISDYNGHGTNVASQVSSKAAGFAGVTSRTTLMGVKVLGSNGVGGFVQVISGFLWAVDNGADVVNMSLGGGFSKVASGPLLSFINRVFNYARQQGVLVVVASGNEGIDFQHARTFYASYCDAPHVICVAGVGPETPTGDPHAVAPFSNIGRQTVDLAAPSGNGDFANGLPSYQWPWSNPAMPSDFFDKFSIVFSLCSKTALAGFNPAGQPILPCASGVVPLGAVGTSAAAPHVSGLAALLIAEFGKQQPQKIKQIMQRTSDPVDPQFGRGVINVRRALGLPEPSAP